VVREGLAAVLSGEPNFSIVGEADTGEAALREVERLRPDVVMLDHRLPGMSGTEACALLMRRYPALRVVILTSYPHEGAMLSAFSAGASGFVLKESEPSTLRDAVRSVAAGESFTDPKVSVKAGAMTSRRAKGPFGLSMQEMRVLEHLPRGLTNREIGAQLGISEETVKTHLRNVLRKLGAKDRAEAASIAIRKGLA
jgi:DNA-binding NarL/FixJ family response regulator